MKQFLYILSIVSLFFISCEDNGDIDPNISNYFPLTQGSWMEYKLDSTIYNDFDNSVTLREWDLRVEIGDTFVDSEGDTTTRMHRYLKPRGSNQPYEYQTTWFVKERNGRVETIEENLRFVKLFSQPQIDIEWEGNSFIQPSGGDNPNTSTRFYQDWVYTYLEVNEPMTIGGQSIENVTTIQQSDRVGGPGAVNHFVSYEYYAKDIGLVKKRMEIVVENCGSDGCSEKNLPVLERTQLRKGFILDMEITDWNIL